MGRLIQIDYVLHGAEGNPLTDCARLPLPVLFRSNGELWEEGSAYLCSMARDISELGGSIETTSSIAWHLHYYLLFCESMEFDPMLFGVARIDKPTYRFRGHLIRRIRGEISPVLATSTAQSRIRAVISFYRWLLDSGQLSPTAQPFVEKRKTLRRQTSTRSYSTEVRSTDLTIRRGRHSPSSILEDGLHPVSIEYRNQMIEASRRLCSLEFSLILEIGFLTGMRLGTITGLTIEALRLARGAEFASYKYIRVGPACGIPTKFDVTYSPLVPISLLQRLEGYTTSFRRLARENRSIEKDKGLLFLNRFGKPYNAEHGAASSSASQELHKLRKGLSHLDLSSFYFHCTRATFGTGVVLAGLRVGERLDVIINRLKDLLGHKDASVSLKYVDFVENQERNERIERELEGNSSEGH